MVSFFAKTDILTGNPVWKASRTCISTDAFLVCVLALGAVQASFIANGSRPLFFRKSAWIDSASRWKRYGLAYIWAFVFQATAITVCNFASAIGSYGVIISGTVAVLMEISVIAL